MLFYPKQFAAEKDITDLDHFKLTTDQLKRYAMQVQRLRTEIRQRAKRLEPSVERPQVDQRKQRSSKISQESNRQHSKLSTPVGKEPTPTLLRKRAQRRKLQLSDIIDIVHRVQIGKESEATVAKHYNVNQATVSRHVCKVRKRPELLSEMLTLRHAQ